MHKSKAEINYTIQETQQSQIQGRILSFIVNYVNL